MSPYEHLRCAQFDLILNGLVQDQACSVPAKQIKGMLTDDEYAAYSRLRDDYRQERRSLLDAPLQCGPDGVEYWEKVKKAISMKVNASKLKDGPRKRREIEMALWAGQDALDHLEKLAPADRRWFRLVDIRDKLYDRIQDLEWPLEMPKLPLDDMPWLHCVENTAQREILDEVIRKLRHEDDKVEQSAAASCRADGAILIKSLRRLRS